MSECSRKVLFVCTGNTCRSPMAEGIFKRVTKGENFEVSSAGVAAMPGGAASRETLDILQEKNAPLGHFQSRMVDEKMLAEADAVFCMTAAHLETLEMMHPEHETKYHLTCDFMEIDGQVGADVPDPIGQGRPAYDYVAQVLEEAAINISSFLQQR